MVAPWKKSYDKPGQHIKKQRHYFTDKGPYSQAMVFPAVMYGCEKLDHKEGWVPKNWCFWTVVLEKTLESPLDFKDIKPVNPKGNQSWIFMRRTDAEAEAPIFWPPDAKSRLIRKDPDTWKVWRQKKGMTEGDMVGWHHWLNEHEFEQAPGDGAGQGSLACCSPWGHKESDTTEWLNSSNDCFFFLSKQFITTCIIWILFYNSNLGNYFQSHLRSPKRKLILSLYNHNSEKMDSGDCD